MARIHTHYDNLKVARDAPPEVIRAAYKTLSQKYHPDRNPGSADAMRIIQIINSAYEVLSDPLKRDAHDQWIAKVESAQRKPGTATRPPHANPPQQAGAYRQSSPQSSRRQRHSGLSKIFRKMEAMLDGMFRMLSRKMRHAPHTRRR